MMNWCSNVATLITFRIQDCITVLLLLMVKHTLVKDRHVLAMIKKDTLSLCS